MSPTPSNAVASAARHLSRLSGVALLLALLCIPAAAQTAPPSNSSGGITPMGMKPGAPAGSYALSGLDTVNHFNGLMNFRLPLLSVGGRGSAGYTMTLAIQQTWQVRHIRAPSGCGPGGCTGPTIHKYIPDPNPWEVVGAGLGPGVMYIRRSGNNFMYVGGCTWYAETLTRLTFIGPDGTEYDFRDQLYNGQPKPNQHAGGQCDTGLVSRGRVFTTYDGSNVTFISDSVISDYSMFQNQYDYPSGYMLLKDGARYRISGGGVEWIQDRSGNRVTFTNAAGVMTITDSLGRQVTVESTASDPTYGSCTRIHFDGAGGVPRTIYVLTANLGDALRPGYFLQSMAQLFPELDGASATGQFNGGVVSGLVLPDGRQYRFQYNSYRDLARVELPTGGAYEYDYVNYSGVYTSGTGSDNSSDYGVNRRLIERRVYADGSTLEGKTGFSSGSLAIVDNLSPAGALLGRTKHYFYGDPLTSLGSPNSYPSWQQGKEYKTEVYDVVSGAAVLKKSVENTFRQRAVLSWWTWGADSSPANDPREVESVRTLADTNQVSKTTSINPANGNVGYDQYNNPTDTWEYDFGAGAPSARPVRHTHTDYLTTNPANGLSYTTVNPSTTSPDPAATIHVRGLAVAQHVYAVNPTTGAETLAAKGTTAYDEPAYPLLTYGSVTGWFVPGTAGRGNPTTTSRWLNTTNTWIAVHAQFDQVGNVRNSWDGNDNLSQFEYSATYKYAYPTRATSPVPDATGLRTPSASLIVTATYDLSTGLMTSVTDANGTKTNYEYNDALDRQTRVVRAVGTALSSQTSVSYDDAARLVTVTSDRDAFDDNMLKSETLYDGLGRTTENRGYETATTYVTTKQTYDALGRTKQTSNPYRAGQTVAWTTTTYDGLGRTLSVRTPDNAVGSTSYSGNTVTVTDQAGKDQQNTTDALGRLTKVVEDPGTGGLGYVTTYAYDVLGNLKTITQGSQTRIFTYDSLSRLKTAFNPESGTISYGHDDNGNLTSKTDARSITTTFTYDALNRLLVKDYSDATPDVNFYYDAQTLPTGAPSLVRGASKGRLVAVTTGGTSAGSYYGYDALGQTLRRIQRTDSINYLSDATYNKAGAVVTETYPSVPGETGRRTLTYSFDAAGRLSSLDSPATPYASGASLTGVSYAAHGGLLSETLGNNLVHALAYNNRLQPTQIKLGTAAAPTSVLSLTYSYGTTENNGDVLSVTNKVGAWTTKQTYTYDPLNRLDTTTETNAAGTTTYWTEDNDYDQYGNRWEVIGGVPSLSISTANNQITTSGYDYDAGGNLTDDTAHTYVYDAENKIKTVDGVANTYVYDGEGRRVKTYFPLGEQVRFVYGVGGQLIMEFSTATGALNREYVYGSGGLLATIDSADGTQYMTADRLGSLRVVTDDAGGVDARHDYKPFGQELPVGLGGRTTGLGFVTDTARKKFTGYERDKDTGLDFAQARYYSPTEGRFTSVDPFGAGSNVHNPQSFNRYTYVLNNPTNAVDPTGLFADDPYHHELEDAEQRYLQGDEQQSQQQQQNPATPTTHHGNGESSGDGDGSPAEPQITDDQTVIFTEVEVLDAEGRVVGGKTRSDENQEQADRSVPVRDTYNLYLRQATGINACDSDPQPITVRVRFTVKKDREINPENKEQKVVAMSGQQQEFAPYLRPTQTGWYQFNFEAGYVDFTVRRKGGPVANPKFTVVVSTLEKRALSTPFRFNSKVYIKLSCQ
jgi:RHS repeat-associated protein